MRNSLMMMSVLACLTSTVALAQTTDLGSTKADIAKQVSQSFSRLENLSSTSVTSIPTLPNEGTDQYRLRVISTLSSAGQKIGVLRAKSSENSDQFFILGQDGEQQPCLIRVTKESAGTVYEQSLVMVIPKPSLDGYVPSLGFAFAANSKKTASLTQSGSSILMAGRTSDFSYHGAPGGEYNGVAEFNMNMDSDSLMISQVTSTFTYRRQKEVHGLLMGFLDGLAQTGEDYHPQMQTYTLNYQCSSL